MTQSGNGEFAIKQPTAENNFGIKNVNTATGSARPNRDILLHNFQINKKRFRVLLNYDHIVWQPLDAKSHQPDDVKKTTTIKETSAETEQLSHRAQYGSSSHIVHINEVIKVAKGNTKTATYRNNPAGDFNVAPPNSNSNTTAPPTEQYLTIHYAERIVHSPSDCNRWHVCALTLYNTDPYVVRQWHAELTKLLRNSPRVRVQHLLVFINPYGGRKQGLQVYERHCKPLFQLAGIDASCIISQRANQIRDILMSHDLSTYDAVCCVGGDGTVAEVINGLIFRSIRDLGMDARRPDFIPKPALPLGIIPAGSTDAVAYSLHGTADVRTAAIHLILGQRRGLDICSVRNPSGIVRFFAGMLSYGYLGDVAAKSEKYRWMGPKRYDYTGAKSLFLNRGYEAEIRLLLPDEALSTPHPSGSSGYDSVTEATASIETICYANCPRCSSSVTAEEAQSRCQSLLNNKSTTTCLTEATDVDSGELPTESNTNAEENACQADLARKSNSVLSEVTTEVTDEGSQVLLRNMTDCDMRFKDITYGDQMKKLQPTNQKQQQIDSGTHPVEEIEDKLEVKDLPKSVTTATSAFSSTNSISDNLYNHHNLSNESKWKLIQGKFFMISGANITCACSKSPNGFSRYNHLGDGYLDLILVRSTSLANILRFLVASMSRNGDIRDFPFVETYRTRKFNFRTPYTDEHYSNTGSCQPISEAFEDKDMHVSCWNCDGEVVNDLDMTMSSHCQLIDVFMRGPHSYTKPVETEEKCTFCCCN